MKYAIFGESPEALKLAERMRAEGNQAFIRNPLFFDRDNFDYSADVAVTDDEIVAAAFQKKGKMTMRFADLIAEPKAKAAPAPVKAAEPKAEAKPAARGRKPKK